MKIQITNIQGNKTKETETKLFEEPIRKDIILKVAESEKIKHPYSTKYRAGMDRSSSGNTSKRRHVWKSDRGKGLARLPRKIFWRRGTQFSWEAAIVPGVRGGRKAHPPKGSVKLKRINKKEFKKALGSALSYVCSIKEIKNKYSKLNDSDLKNPFPIILEDKITNLKTKETRKLLENVLSDFKDVVFQKKSIRAGIGKLRGRKNKKNAGALMVIGNNQKFNINSIDVVKCNELLVKDLAGNGARITLFSEQAIKDLEKILFHKGEKK